MEYSGVMGGLYKISEWITRLAYVNVLWIFFSILGIFVVGFFPATVAMFTVIRKLALGEVDTPIFQTYWMTVKKELVKSNILGYIVILFGVLLYVNFSIIQESTSTISYLYYPTLILILLFLLTLFYVFPVYVHFKLNIFTSLRNALFLMIINPIATVIMIIGSVVIFILLDFFPALILFFGGSAGTLLVMTISMWAFNRMLNKGQADSEKMENA
ncbi:YesL family protein [Halalkalibacter kiskunsagensis]|uniref:YesL family protein n=1 Tax=Halalkalibacter kiskunsagensis TaxID=1548599 RepID=A0ABV6KCG3_9BACI